MLAITFCEKNEMNFQITIPDFPIDFFFTNEQLVDVIQFCFYS